MSGNFKDHIRIILLKNKQKHKKIYHIHVMFLFLSYMIILLIHITFSNTDNIIL